MLNLLFDVTDERTCQVFFCIGPLSTILRQKRNYFLMFYLFLLHILNQSAGTVSQIYKRPQWVGVASVCRRPQSRQVKWEIQEFEDYRAVRHRCPRSSKKRGTCDKGKRFENARRIFKISCYCFEKRACSIIL